MFDKLPKFALGYRSVLASGVNDQLHITFGKTVKVFPSVFVKIKNFGDINFFELTRKLLEIPIPKFRDGS